MSSPIAFRDVSVTTREGRSLLEGVSVEIGAGESVAVVGRSGAGKTTLLRLVNGLVTPSRGVVEIDGRLPDDLVAVRRRIGYVVQSIGLFPHRTVFDNVATVPRLKGWDEGRIEDAVCRALERVHLPATTFRSRFPHSLSGGEQQRVGIARATVFDPDILLCDEPFGALDPIVRRAQQDLLVSTSRERQPTTLFVTHDLAEALYVADRVMLVEGGRVVADAPSSEFADLDHPIVRAFVDATRLPEAGP